MKTSYIRVPFLGTRVLTHNHNGSHGTGAAQWALPVSCGAAGSPGSEAEMRIWAEGTCHGTSNISHSG